MSITYGQINKAIASALGTATGVERSEAYDAISEGVPVFPMLKVYSQNGETDADSDSDRASFGAGIRRCKNTLLVEGYARPRSNAADDLRAQMDLIDALDARLCQEVNKPFFGLPGIQSFHWRWERSTFKMGDGADAPTFAGVSLTIEMWVY